MKFFISIVATILSAASVITAAALPSSAKRGDWCNPGTYECAPGDVSIVSSNPFLLFQLERNNLG
jgi:hypothetical protein